MRRISQVEFERRLSETHPEIEPLEPYSRMTDKILCRCKTCGHEWRVRPANLFSGNSCPKCGRERTAKAQRKSHEQFVAELNEINPEVEVLGEYENGNARITVRCKVCGNEWAPRAQSLLKGYGCWECGKKKIGKALKKSHEAFIAQMEEINPDIEVLGTYEGDNVKVDVRCKVCGNEWMITPGGLIAGHGCPECAKTSTSLSEQYILQGLRMVLGEDEVAHRDTSAIGMELDIFIPRHRVAVEPGGWYWHASKLESDASKRNACRKAGIRLLTVYDNYKEADPPFEEDCLVYPYKLSFEKGFMSLKKIVEHVLGMCEVQHSFTDAEWRKVLRRARRRSSRITTEDFEEKLAAVNDKVIIIGSYVNSSTKIDCECPVCGFRWSATPSHLLSGEACPSCAGTMKHTHDEFVAMIAEISPSVEVVGEYVAARKRVDVRCKECGHVWSPTANSLQQGGACPKCAAERRAASRRLSDREFRSSLEIARPRIEALDEYVNGTTPITFRCKSCGSTWKQEPRLLLYYRGYGCPVCTGRYQGVSDVESNQPSLFDDQEEIDG